MARKKKLKPAQVTEALRQSHGLKTGACEILGVTFDTIQRYIVEIPEAQEIIAFWRTRRTDRAEYKLDEAIERGEAWAIAMTLKDNKGGRERGYGNAVDVNHSGEVATSMSPEQIAEKIAALLEVARQRKENA